MLRWTICLNEGRTYYYNAAVPVGHKAYYFVSYAQFEVHIFNIVSLRWRKLPPVTTGKGECPVEVPSMHWGYTAVLIQDIIYIWGGSSFRISYGYIYYNILYAFDVDTHRWLKPKVSGNVPDGRTGHSACVFGKLMYIHGGSGFKMKSNDIYKLDTTIMAWSLISSRGTPPPVSANHSATIIGTKMFVFGGRGAQNDYNIIRVFDTETNCWLSTPSAQLLPELRGGLSAFTYNGQLYIFGGDNQNQTFKDLWKLNPETFSWKKVEPKGKGPYRTLGMCCMVEDRVILFGGNPTPYDLYILDLSPSLKSLCKLAVIQYSVDQLGLPHDIRWEMAAMTKNSNSVGQTN